MMCHSVRELIPPLLDEELQADQKADVEGHLQGCVGCAELHHQLSELRATVRAGAPYYRAPENLPGRIESALRKADRAEARPRQPWTWITVAATLASAAAILWAVVVLRPRAPEPDLVAQEIVSSHVRSLMASHLMDVPSKDQHTVKPWFAGKLDFSPPVKDLTPQGYHLAGGRLDYLDKRAVAALVYQRRQHMINLFIWPAAHPSGSTNSSFMLNGFNIVHWTGGGLGYWAVSDLNADELREFAHLYGE
jgi:anti-sigma factor RsiW